MLENERSLILRGVSMSVAMFTTKTKLQGLNIMVKKLEAYINESNVVFVNNIAGIDTFTPDVVLLYEIVFYHLKDTVIGDITATSKAIVKKLKSVKFSLSNYFLFKFDLDSYLRRLAMSDGLYNEFSEEYKFLVTLNMVRNVLDVCLFSAHDRDVVGVDVSRNTAIYGYSEKLFDRMNGIFRSITEAREFVALFDELNKQRMLSIRLGSCSRDGVSDEQLLADINDKVDDNLRLISTSRVVLSIINSLDSGVKFANPSVALFRGSLFEGYMTDVDTCQFRERKAISSTKGNLLVVRDERSVLESVLVKDVVIGGFVCVAVSYRLRTGVEDAFIIPLKYSTFLGIASEDTLDVVKDFYGLEGNTPPEYEVLSHNYWKYRTKKYISEGDKVTKGKVEREHKIIEVGAFLRKADNHSPEAEKLAKKYCIDLKKGYTLVRPHTREYGKVKED